MTERLPQPDDQDRPLHVEIELPPKQSHQPAILETEPNHQADNANSNQNKQSAYVDNSKSEAPTAAAAAAAAAAGESAKQQTQNFNFDDMNYLQNQSFLGIFFFTHLLSVIRKMKRVVVANIPMKLNHIPSLDDDAKVQYTTQRFYDRLEREQAAIQAQPGNKSLTPFQAFKILTSFYKSQIILSFSVGLVEIGMKMFASISLNYCIQSIIDSNESRSYMWAGLLVFAMFMQSIFRHHSWTVGQNLNSQFRLMLVDSIYKKINKLSSHSIREANIGKVINLVSSDLNSTENKFFFLFQIAFAPFTLAAGCIILAFRLGPYGLLSVAMLLFVFPLQQFFGKMQLKYLQTRTHKSDERIKIINESIDGIRLIKMYGWEEAFRRMVENIRNQEVTAAKTGQIISYIEKSISTTSVFIVASITFIIIHYYGSMELNSAKIFSTIEILQYIKINVMMFSGMGIGYIFELKIFLQRFLDIFFIKEAEKKTNDNNLQNYTPIASDEVVKFDQFNAYWKAKKIIPQTETEPAQTLGAVEEQKLKKEVSVSPALKNITLGIKKGELLAVVGKISSGKSTLLQSLLQEIPYYEGYFKIKEITEFPDRIQKITEENAAADTSRQLLAYVEQEPYIFSGSVRDNILFGKSFDAEWYQSVVKNCSLLPDFKEMDKGDETEIGEKGINISGGQKARICLARAVYSRAEIYLLDDPLSAVDSKVAKNIFNNCIQGLLKDKTVILVTHQIHFTKDCDRILVLEDGSVNKIGQFSELENELQKLAAGMLKFESSQNGSVAETKSIVQSKSEKKKEKVAENKLKGKAPAEQAKVTLSTYTRFFRIISQVIFGFPFILFSLFILAECAFTAFNRGLGYYDSTSDNSKADLFGFWLGMSFVYLLINVFKYNLLAIGSITGTRLIHNQMFKALTRAKTVFFDSTPGGALLNKFSNDINILDGILHYSANDAMDIFANFLNLIITCCIINPYIIIIGVVELACLSWFLAYNKELIVKSKQIDLENKTPVFQFFQSTLQGIVPINIYNQKPRFLDRMSNLCNNSIRTNMTFWHCGRFFGVFVQYITIFCSAVGIFVIISASNSNPSLIGQSLTYLVLMTDSIQWCLRQIINVDSVMSSCERTYTLMDQPPEADLTTEFDSANGLLPKRTAGTAPTQKDTTTVAEQWPKEGRLSFENVVMRYNKDLNPVLKGLSFEILPGEKIGCIGRTGAGKSSILQALFRMTESESGSVIRFDGIDISKVGLHTLRQKISIIPQVPFVFAGSIRRNLDPLMEHTDNEIWDALNLVELDDYVRGRFASGIHTDMTDVSSVFSVGQKQLICLARAVLKSNKLLVLDEATANVDMETDNLIQKTIRNKFSSSSVLTIAHRLNTIADYDKIIVMDDGKVAEFDKPFNLLANSSDDVGITKNSLFAQMVQHTGKNNSQNIFNAAKQKFLESSGQQS